MPGKARYIYMDFMGYSAKNVKCFMYKELIHFVEEYEMTLFFFSFSKFGNNWWE